VSVERYNREQYPKVNEILRPMLETAPTVQTLNVNISTTHKIAASTAASGGKRMAGPSRNGTDAQNKIFLRQREVPDRSRGRFFAKG